MKNKINKRTNRQLVNFFTFRRVPAHPGSQRRYGIEEECHNDAKDSESHRCCKRPVCRYWEWNICPRRYPSWIRRSIYARTRIMSITDVFVVKFIGTDCTGTCKSNYHTITTTTVPITVTWKHEQHRPNYVNPEWYYHWYSVQFMWYKYI